MCGRYTMAVDPALLRSRFPVGDVVPIHKRYNVAPTDPVLTVTTTRDGEPRGELLRWGLVPHWAKDASGGARMINARSETAWEKPAFRDAVGRRRCLVVADGFFEWRRDESGRRPFWITRPDGLPFAFAGAWASWSDGGDEPLRTCTILTAAASEAMGGLHDRMPVLLDPDAEEDWLDPGTPEGRLRELCAPAGDVRLREVSRAVNSVRNDGPECLAPPGPGDALPAPATLF